MRGRIEKRRDSVHGVRSGDPGVSLRRRMHQDAERRDFGFPRRPSFDEMSVRLSSREIDRVRDVIAHAGGASEAFVARSTRRDVFAVSLQDEGFCAAGHEVREAVQAAAAEQATSEAREPLACVLRDDGKRLGRSRW